MPFVYMFIVYCMYVYSIVCMYIVLYIMEEEEVPVKKEVRLVPHTISGLH